ncbi:MAG: hypothetical protein WC824_05490 [Bacteroidota bacterium]|jgi:hypothetical protein
MSSYSFCKPEIVQFIDRSIDTVYYKRFYQNDVAIVYCTYDSAGIYSAQQKQYTWVCEDESGRVIGSGTLLSETGMSGMYKLLDSLGEQSETKLKESFLATLDETDTPIIMPIYSSRIGEDLIAIADEGRRTVMLYNIHTGKKVYEKAIDDSLVIVAVADGEELYSGFMNSPRFRAVDLEESGTLAVIGSIPVQGLKDDGKMHIYSRMYYCRIDYKNDIVVVNRLEDICEELWFYTYENSHLLGESIIATSPTWRIGETSYDSLYCLTYVNMSTCKVTEYAKMDDIYKHLDIGENLCTGHMAVAAGDVFTTQTLSPWIVKEGASMRIAKYDSLFKIQSDSSLEDGAKLAKIGNTPFERSDMYRPRIYTIALFSVDDRYVVDVSYVPEEGRAGCMVYDTKTEKVNSVGDVRYGGFLETGDSGFIVVTKENSRYNIYRYDIGK